MAKKKRQRRNKKKKRKAANQAAPTVVESRGSLMVTVFWMLTVLAALVATFVAFVARLVAEKPDSSNEVIFIANMLIGTALITGTLAVILAPIAYRLRQLKPPRAIVVVAVLVGLLPWLIFSIR